MRAVEGNRREELESSSGYALRLRTASALAGGIAAFLGLIQATFWWLVDSVVGGGTPFASAAFALIGLLGAAIARHQPRACAALELIASIGVFAGSHIILGSLFLAAAMLALGSLRASPPARQMKRTVRADAASAFTFVGVAGLAVVVALALLVIGVLALSAALSGGSSDGAGGAMTGAALTIVVSIVFAVALLVCRARRRN